MCTHATKTCPHLYILYSFYGAVRLSVCLSVCCLSVCLLSACLSVCLLSVCLWWYAECGCVLLQREDREWLLLLTSRYHVAVLAYDAASEDVLTKAYGDVKVCDSSNASGCVW